MGLVHTLVLATQPSLATLAVYVECAAKTFLNSPPGVLTEMFTVPANGCKLMEASVKLAVH